VIRPLRQIVALYMPVAFERSRRGNVETLSLPPFWTYYEMADAMIEGLRKEGYHIVPINPENPDDQTKAAAGPD
jgi:hypothetical protein